ncbi:high mobility group box 3 [Coemansia sp. RSA 2049]|nr:high mobility group box 3 [Coemansia sp. RSA 2049]KAJ2612929.1 high mobility group box 3 [Coemansia sp. RSA 1804]
MVAESPRRVIVSPEDAQEISEAYSKLADLYKRIAKTSEAAKPIEGRSTVRDPNRPKRPLTSYLLFANENRNSILNKFPDLPPRDAPLKIGQAWKGLSDTQRQKYVDKAKQLKLKYDVEVKKYNSREKNKSAVETHKDEGEHARSNGTGESALLDEHASDSANDGSDVEPLPSQQIKKPKKKQHNDKGVEKAKKRKVSKPKEGASGVDEAPKKKKKAKQ